MRYFSFLIYIFSALFLVACNNDSNTTTENLAEEKKENIAEKVPTLKEQLATANFEETSQLFLQTLRNGGDYNLVKEELAAINPAALEVELDTDAKRKAFWINTYNGMIQAVLTEQPDLFKDRDAFFKEERFAVAGKALSFDMVEHGIIRSTTGKVSGGYLPKLFPSDFEKRFQVKELDPRYHFVLNCGAKDCPPVYNFNSATINDDMEQIAATYVQKHSDYDKIKNVVTTTPLFSWFRGDFDGKDDVVEEWLVRYKVIPVGAEPELEFKDYNWTLALGNFGGEV